LKDAWPSAVKSDIEDATLKLESAKQALRRQKIVTVARAEIAYWKAWMAKQHVELRARSLGIARSLVEDNERRRKAGKMSEMEVEQAKVGAAYRERKWLEAQTDWTEALRDIMNAIGWQVDERQVQIQVEEAPLDRPVSLDFAARMRSASEHHPDILISRKEIDIKDLHLAIAKNSRWPQLDLSASYGLNGLGSSAQDSLEDINESDYPSWSIGVVFRTGLCKSQAARAEFEEAKLAKERALQSYKATETSVVNSLRSTIAKVGLLKRILDALKGEVGVNRMALDNEKVLLETGKSTSRKMLALEEDLTDSQVDYLLAKTRYLQTLVQLDLADGTMLARRKLE